MLGAEDMFGLRSGRAALEIYPRLGWDKGSAVKYIARMLGLERALPICFGDDTTDESMYRALPNGITVNVGPRAQRTPLSARRRCRGRDAFSGTSADRDRGPSLALLSLACAARWPLQGIFRRDSK